MKLAFLMGLVWCESLLYASGIGIQISLYEYFILAALVYSFILYFTEPQREFTKLSKLLFLTVPVIALFQYVGFEISGTYTLKYISAFTVTYIISRQNVKAKEILFTSYVYGGLGFAVLLIYNFGNAFSGWNPNHIGILCMFSYLFLVCGICTLKRDRIKLTFLLLISLLYFILLNKCASRGATLFCCLALICVLNRRKVAYLYAKTSFRNIVVLIPLIMAFGVVLFSRYADMAYWDAWSESNWGKTLFNGRDILWGIGLEKVAQHWIMGIGNLSVLNWHNSAITTLVAFGFLGYSLLSMIYLSILKKASFYSKDTICNMLITVFAVIYLEQSVELGMVAEKVYFIPYAALGLILGRINTIKRSNVCN